MSDIREQIEQVRRTQAAYRKTGLIGLYDHVLLKQQGQLADTMEKLLAALEDISDGNTDSCGDCRYNEERAKQAIQ